MMKTRYKNITLPSFFIILSFLPGFAISFLAQQQQQQHRRGRRHDHPRHLLTSSSAATSHYLSSSSSALSEMSSSSSSAASSIPLWLSSSTTTALTSRRCCILAPLAFLLLPDVAGAVEGEKKRGVVTLTLTDPDDKLGLEVYETTIGSSPPKPVIAIRKVISTIGGRSANAQLQPGMICRDFDGNVATLRRRLQEGPFPIKLQFENLAAGGDAFDDLGRPIVSAQDALRMAQQQQQQKDPRMGYSSVGGGAVVGDNNADEYSITVLESPPSDCKIQSRRNDLLEIRYEAHVGSVDGPIYDSSATRGTGQPYQTVLGSYDIIPGVDQGLYDMCPAEKRRIVIPPRLGYGSRGNKLFKIPPDTSLVWDVELVSINSVRKGDTRTRDDLEGRVEYY